jgi:signal transduction histidine kinase
VQEDIKNLLEESGARIITHFEVPQIQYARKNLRSILYNLLSNAVKYRDPHRLPEVHVKTRSTPEGIVLTIEDNGLGIDDNKQHKLFAMFQRLHVHVEGTGIGLYIVKRIIENNGGRIEVASQPGRGTIFTITFPDKVPQPIEIAEALA